ncbi:hypothetical protein ASG31_16735 [Chryseobacterium sp. Leaf404]|uniref:alpha/beta hydrolase family protein n=1 Tax=unclassified Chryseobacterium TaxID=2593645 RepID=UPI0006FD5C9A|nr:MULTISPECIES: prolyl oligopeptidase family serine peptidase [unclassified Chryseobacterium]KQT20831.1 hypothetical protein ASG31_16735 [Chryseobacterium sp. Leaf404]
MDTKLKVISAVFFLFLMVSVRAGEKSVSDSADQQKNQAQYILGNLLVSEDGRWSAVRKIYVSSKDTMLVFDRQKPDLPVATFVKMNGNTAFSGKNAFLASGSGRAEWINLLNKEKKPFENVKETAVLSSQKRFFILYKNNILSVYNENATMQKSMDNAVSIHTDYENILYVISKKDGQTYVTDFSGNNPIEVYKTGRLIKRSHLTESGGYIAVTETDEKSMEVFYTIVDLKNKSVRSFKVGEANTFIRAEISEISGERALWIDIQSKVIPPVVTPDIWYGSDGDLQAKISGQQEKHYFIWRDEDLLPAPVQDKKFTVFAPVNSREHVLAFNPRKNFRYDTRVPMINVYLYHLKQNKAVEVLRSSREIVVSSSGNDLLSYHSEYKKWILYKIKSGQQFTIDQEGLEKPVYDEERQQVFFESKTGLYLFDMKKRICSPVNGTQGSKTTVSNTDTVLLNSMYHISTSTVSENKPLLVRLQTSDNKTSYLSYHHGKWTTVLAPVINNIREFRADQMGKTAYTLEENYNMPPKLFLYNHITGKKSVVFNGNTNDRTAFAIKQDIVGYKNREGRELKGLLYYPAEFDPSKKYPMIVSIYQMRSNRSNEYLFNNSSIGFDVGKYLENGYFIFLPDIVFEKKGAGLSALDCVNAALDALINHPNINQNKIGLTGHSMGGFETNFIATHSKRFAAFLTGSGHSDIIRAYFSFNYNNNLPLTWQFENGQYAFNRSFADDKEMYFKNNPVHYVDQVSAPILLWTGLKDENVKWDHTMEFYIGLKRYGKPVIALFYPEGGHNLLHSPKNNVDLTVRTMEWWDYFLKDQKEVEWIRKEFDDADTY